MKQIHLCNWSQQPDIKIACSGKYTQPSRSNNTYNISGIYEDLEGELYTFDKELVSCEECERKTST